jgi:F0F1-type ATP synthase membrane subunit b/b'
MNELTGIFGLLMILAVLALALAAILMPIFVIMIDSRVEKISKTLAAMERLMRHGS